jgi:hypothetical protein
MAKFLQLALWNANGLTQHKELKTFISIYNIGIMLISEAHFTEKKLSKTFELCSLPYEPSSRNCYNNKNYHQASSTKQQ